MTERRRTAAANGAEARTRSAVATLLRLADADLRDAAVLEAGRNPRNAPALAAQGVARLIDAVAATEVGWRSRASGRALELIPDQNPLKRSLTALDRQLPNVAIPMPGDDGQAPGAPDRDALRSGMREANALLKELAARR